MQVILLEKIRNLGALGDTVKVKPGYARNFLIPQGKAVFASKENIAKFEKRRAELEKTAVERHGKAEERQKAIDALGPISVTAKAGDEGKLFGSITSRDIVSALQKAGVEVEKREVRMPEGSIRMVGDYEIIIELDSDVNSIVKFSVVAEG